jgi:hypothetical protein
MHSEIINSYNNVIQDIKYMKYKKIYSNIVLDYFGSYDEYELYQKKYEEKSDIVTSSKALYNNLNLFIKLLQKINDKKISLIMKHVKLLEHIKIFNRYKSLIDAELSWYNLYITYHSQKYGFKKSILYKIFTKQYINLYYDGFFPIYC